MTIDKTDNLYLLEAYPKRGNKQKISVNQQEKEELLAEYYHHNKNKNLIELDITTFQPLISSTE